MKKYSKLNVYSSALSVLLMAIFVPTMSGLNNAQAAATDIAHAPLITSNAAANVVKPNLMLIMDDSKSMEQNFMPDNAGDFAGKYGFASSQCNGVYYNPNITYKAPVDSTGTNYADATFTAAWINGYKHSDGTTNLSTNFKANATDVAEGAYYYAYSGTQTTEKQRDYYDTSKTFYIECDGAIGGGGPFTKVDVNASGTAAEKQNFANWYSYYRTRMLMMKSSTGLAFKTVGDRFRVGYMSINNNTGTDYLNITDFDATQKSSWYAKLYNSVPNQNTPLRKALSTAGLLYAGKQGATINTVAAVSPVQYACQQNYTLLSTDGFWTGQFDGSGNPLIEGIKVDGTAMGNQDGLLSRPFFDGSARNFNKHTEQLRKTETRITRGTTDVTKREQQLQKKILQLQKKETDSRVNERTIQYQKRQEQLQSIQWTRQIKQDQRTKTTVIRQIQEDTRQQYTVQRQVQQDVLQRYTVPIQQRVVTYTKEETQQQRKRIVYQRCNNEGNNCQDLSYDCTSATGTGTTGSVTRPLCSIKSDTGWQNNSCTAGNGNPVTYCQNLPTVTTTTYGLNSCTNDVSNGKTTVCTIHDSGWSTVASCTANLATGKTCQELTLTPAEKAAALVDDAGCTPNATTGVKCEWKTDSTWENTSECIASAHTRCQDSGSAVTTTNPACTTNTNKGITCGWLTDTTWADLAAGTACTYASTGAGTRCQDKSGSAVTIDVASCTANASTGVSCGWTTDLTWSDGNCTPDAANHITCQNINPVPTNVSSCTPNVNTGLTCEYLSGSGTWDNIGYKNGAALRCVQNAATGTYCRTFSDSGNVLVSSCTASDPATGPTVTCTPLPAPSWVNTGTCSSGTVATITTACQTYDPGWSNSATCTNTGIDGSGADVECQIIDPHTPNTSDGWYGVDSCTTVTATPGLTITCNTITNAEASTTGYVASCECAAAAGSTCNVTATASTTPPWRGVSCSNAIVSPSAPAASCTNAPATLDNGYVTTSCNTVVSATTVVDTCSNVAPDGGNNYVQTICENGVIIAGTGTTDTLADTAAHYYARVYDTATNTEVDKSIRTAALGNCNGPLYNAAIPATNLCTLGLVKAKTSGTDITNDTNKNQHMTTFTVGLGVRGRMTATPSYKTDLTAANQDYLSVKADTARGTDCEWPNDPVNFAGGKCNWPYPAHDTPANVDDLWHAAVNGHGTYFNATDPEKLQEGLTNLLTAITEATKAGAAASSAAASPKISAGNDKLYSPYFFSGEWTGELISQTIDLTSGKVHYDSVSNTIKSYDPLSPNPASYNWSARTLLDAKSVASRKIYTKGNASLPGTNGLIEFNWANMVAAGLDSNFKAPHITTNPPSFPNQLTGLSQFCIVGLDCLSAATQSSAEGSPLVSFLRGDRTNEDGGALVRDLTKYYRHRLHVLGDIVSAEPQYVAQSNLNYDEALNSGYAAFKATNASRAAIIYTAANDGMLHAFNAGTGEEEWAYIPSFAIPKLYTLADDDYADKHQYFVEGTPKVADVKISGAWKTILVGGLGAGGTGYYALDVTDPATPKHLWNFSNDNMGYTFGNPVITKQSDGTWVVLVTSGYDNCPAASATHCAKNGVGDGEGHLFVLNAATGKLVSDPATTSDIATGAGTTTNPSGLSKVAAFAPIDNVTSRVYGGDLQGNLWRFTITPSGYDKLLLATFKDADGNPQPITSKPTVSTVSGKTVVYVGTGRYLGTSDIGSTAKQSFYAVKDTGASYGNPRDSASFIKQQATIDTCPTIADDPLTVTVDESKQYDGICKPGEKIRKVSLVSGNASDTLRNKDGWVLDFPTNYVNASGATVREMNYTDSAIYSGTVLFSTSVATAGINELCGEAVPGEPESFGYKVSYLTGGAIGSQEGIVANVLGAGLATSPRLFELTYTDGSGNTSKKVLTETTLSDGKKVILKPPPNPLVNTPKRLSWTEDE